MALKFGTSGIRGLNSEFSQETMAAYMHAFVGYARTKLPCNKIALAGDLRESTPIIHALVVAELQKLNCDIIDIGLLPTPALALYCTVYNCPGIMITGSHIPADRNGIKFYWPWGEILKADEQAITSHVCNHKPSAPTTPSSAALSSQASCDLPKITDDSLAARKLFIERYTTYFAPFRPLFSNKRVGVYQHSAVSRDLWKPILTSLGFDVFEFGRSYVFTPVDTETDEASHDIAKLLAHENSFFAIISSDGDGDRPLICDEKREVLRGDTVGLLTAAFLKADTVITPVSSNTAIEKSGFFKNVTRTKIGSPFVIEAIIDQTPSYDTTPAGSAPSMKSKIIVGFEANGGVLLGSDLQLHGVTLKALPTRDSFLPVLSCLAFACQKNSTLSEVVKHLPARFTASNVLRDFPVEKKSMIFTAAIHEQDFIEKYGPLVEKNEVDGLRMTFGSGDILHLRPSGNAPEFRCYSESTSPDQASRIVENAMGWLKAFY